MITACPDLKSLHTLNTQPLSFLFLFNTCDLSFPSPELTRLLNSGTKNRHHFVLSLWVTCFVFRSLPLCVFHSFQCFLFLPSPVFFPPHSTCTSLPHFLYSSFYCTFQLYLIKARLQFPHCLPPASLHSFSRLMANIALTCGVRNAFNFICMCVSSFLKKPPCSPV